MFRQVMLVLCALIGSRFESLASRRIVLSFVGKKTRWILYFSCFSGQLYALSVAILFNSLLSAIIYHGVI